jgi:predicted transglutaminase-like cysteine proteinase
MAFSGDRRKAMRRAAYWVAVATYVSLLGAAPALARDSAPGFMLLGARMEAPRGFVEMCATSPGPLCHNGEAPVAELRFASAQWPTGAIGRAPANITLPNRAVLQPSLDEAYTPRAQRFDLLSAWGDRPFTLPDAPVIADEAAISAALPDPADGALWADIALTHRASSAPLPEPFATDRQTLDPLWSLDHLTIRLTPTLFEPEDGSTTASIMQPAVATEILSPTILPDGFDAMKMLKTVHRQVNGQVRQRTDMQIFGKAELWQRSGMGKTARGDCEDLAIEKRLRLMASGFPADRMFFAVVYHQTLGLHVVLMARLDDGDYALDSRSPYVQPWRALPYSVVSIQDATDPARWFTPGRPRLVLNAEPAQGQS